MEIEPTDAQKAYFGGLTAGARGEGAESPKPLSMMERVDRFLELLDETEGEFTPEVEAAFESIAAKAEAYGHACRRLAMEAEQTKQLADAYAARAKAKTARAESLKERLHMALRLAGVERVQTPTLNVRVQKNSSAALVLHVPEAAIPEQYKVLVPASWKLSPDALKAAITNGEIETVRNPEQPDAEAPDAMIPIATLERGTHVRFS